MKKYIVLGLATIIFISVFTFSGDLIKRNIPFVSVYCVTPQSVDDVVVSSGKIKYAKEKKIYAPANCIVKNLLVNEGKQVKAGEKLAELLIINEENNSKDSLTKDVYSAVINGDYSMLDEYDKYLESIELSDDTYQEYAQQTAVQTTFDVCAPINGTVTNLKYSEGDYANAAGDMLTIVTGDKLEVKLNINEDRINSIKKGQSVTITGTAFEGEELNGTVTKISREATQTTTAAGNETTVGVIVAINNPSENIRPGYTAKCKIITNTNDSTLILPYSSINTEEDGSEYIWVYNNGLALKKSISTDKEYSDGIEVTKGVKSGEYVIVSNISLTDGSVVKVSENSAVTENA